MLERRTSDTASRADVAIIGGTGFYEFLVDPEKVDPSTPYGQASGPVSIGTVGERRVVFLPRHGAGHALPPHRINYRANMWLLRSLGVRQVLAPCAVGGLLPSVAPGDLVVPDQLVDRTSGRTQTYVESSAVHAPFADPYCGRLLASLRQREDLSVGGAMVVIEGPRFSTRAESRHYADQGWALVNMTGHPEAVLAREMQLCYAAIALVTDMDAGVEEGSGVGQEEVFALFAANVERLKTTLSELLGDLPDPDGCSCSTWADGLELDYLP
ncbi:MAG: S-methyl-5'-thioadenosine phosphorylase [Marmoricola sp.]